MVGWCAVWYGGVLSGRVVYCVRMVQCLVGPCNVRYGGALYARDVHCLVGRFTVC